MTKKTIVVTSVLSQKKAIAVKIIYIGVDVAIRPTEKSAERK